MPFVFNKELARKKQADKFQEAEARAKEVFSRHPELAALNTEIKAKKLKLRGAILYNLSQAAKKKLTDEIATLNKQITSYLQKEGIPADFSQPRWDCPTCQDRGEVLTPQGYVPCNCRKVHFLRQFQLASDLPKRFFSAGFEVARLDLYPTTAEEGDKFSPRIRAEKAYEAARQFVNSMTVENNPIGLVYDGRPGSGKTYLLACIANAIMARGISCQYINYNDFLYKLKMSFGEAAPFSEYELIERIETASLLLIDDLGTEIATDFSSATLFRIIEKRYAQQMPFVVSTSISLNELKNRLGYLGDKILQRIIESCTHHRLTGDVRQALIARRLADNG